MGKVMQYIYKEYYTAVKNKNSAVFFNVMELEDMLNEINQMERGYSHSSV